jgi:RNA polymerase primary sigma factor
MGGNVGIDLNHALLNCVEERDLLTRSRLGDGLARDAMVLNNMRLVRHHAQQFLTNGVEIDDLVSAGTVGLMAAIERFDHTKEHKFSTYAAWFIRKELSDVAIRGHVIRPPYMWNVHNAKGWTQESKRRAIAATKSTTFSQVDRDDMRRVETSRDRGAPNPVHLASKHDDLSAMRAVMRKVLTPRERVMVDLRFGLTTCVARSLREIGSMLGLTSERVRQCIDAALQKLRRQMEKQHQTPDVLGHASRQRLKRQRTKRRFQSRRSRLTY